MPSNERVMVSESIRTTLTINPATNEFVRFDLSMSLWCDSDPQAIARTESTLNTILKARAQKRIEEWRKLYGGDEEEYV
jgi:hypothetical protein